MKHKKALSLTSAMLIAFSSLTACKPNAVADDENTLEIYATEAGYGIQWLYDMETIFETENPSINVEITSDKGVELANDKVSSGPDINTADLIFSLEDWENIVLAGKNGVSGYDYALADMTNFLETEIDGQKLKDKFRPYYLKNLEIELEEFDWEPHYFALPWAASATGIVYNVSLFEEKGWSLPRTSNELVALAKDIKTAGYIPFCNETGTGYIGYIAASFWAQYDGADYYYDYINPVSEDAWIEYTTNPSSKGRLYAMKVAEELFNKDDGLLNPNAQQDDYARAQGRLISKEGAMSVNGDWFNNEMALTISQANAQGNNFKAGMMMTPVISCLVDKLDFWGEEYSKSYYEQISDPPVAPLVSVFDTYLADIVDYVDGKTTTVPTITIGTNTYTATEADIELVKSARGAHRSLSSGHTVVIPSYAKAKDAAFKFLELFYSEKGSQIFIEATKGGLSSVQFDVTKWSGYETANHFQKDVFNLVNNGTPICFPSDRFYGLPDITCRFYLYSKSDVNNYKTPEKYFEERSWTRQEYLDFMISAGAM